MNSKDLIKYGLIALGAYLIYEYIQKNGGLSGIFGTTAAAGTTPPIGTTPTTIPSSATAPSGPGSQMLANAQALLSPAGITLSAAQQAQIVSGQATNLMQVLTPAQLAQFNAYGQAHPQPMYAVPVAPPNPVNPAPVPVSWTSPSPQPSVAVVAPISQRMLAAAGTNSLNMDQWCFYFTAATGQACPVDPGSIDPSVYVGAGIVDRTTPTDVGTWLAIMQNQAPQLGLMGLGAMRYTPAWLM